MTNPAPIVIVSGPTASGKSALAVDLAEIFSGSVINADSMQVYKELRILSARPTIADEERVPHRLYGILPARKPCSAGRWCSMALTDELLSLSAELAWSSQHMPVMYCEKAMALLAG